MMRNCATEIMDAIPRESKIFRSFTDNTPLRGVGKAEDVGRLARFLVGNESRWITGQCINCDGGQLLRRGPHFTQSVQAKFGVDVLPGRLPSLTENRDNG